MSALLSPETLRRLEQFELLARRKSQSAARGERRSKARGQSVEFADHRNYATGDDLRYLDWNLFGRLDRLFVKLYEEERELPLLLLIDTSESMSFGAARKLDFALKVAAALGHVALCGFDRVTVMPFPEVPENAGARMALRGIRGRKSSLRFLETLGRLQPKGPGRLNESLRQAALQSPHAGLAVVLSDFLDPEGYEPGLTALLGRGFQVHAMQILAAEEIEPDYFGDLRLVDSETGAVQEVTFGKYRLSEYRKMVEGYCLRLREYCQTRGMGWFLARSDTDLGAFLLKELRRAEVWK
ncbi:MAG: DUF58 domain-containing protein [Verrucomicrobia bacterium]|nr:DUF58 domain-containing protein [Verrucomicrobiota bacterium]